MPARFARLLGERFRAPYPRAIQPISFFAVRLRRARATLYSFLLNL
jgi:hypothetical protein